MSGQPEYLNKNLSFEERAKDLVSRMTVDEKASQTMYRSPEIPRFGIPAYNWWNEALHGVARAGTATVFPQAIGMAATFDAVLIEKVADVVSTEGRAMYNAAKAYDDTDIYKGLTYWTPNVNIFRDPRWGRGHETYGEDPYLTAEMGKAFVRGLQGSGKYLKSAACAKHYAVHSGPEKLRHEFDAVCDKRDLFDTYLPAFEELVRDAGVEAVMGAYNRTNGEPCCGSETLLKKILREKWGFKGHVVSDCGAIKDFHENHKVTKTANESAALALKNGCDLNCGNIYLHMLSAFQEGLVTEEDIDKAVIRLMTTRIKLGMFDDEEELEYNKIPYSVVACDEHRKFAVEVAKKSMVLLKNDGILPLDKNNIKSIGVIGPNADSRVALHGNYYGTSPRHVTVLEGIEEELKGTDVRIYYSEGCHLWRDSISNLVQRPMDRLSEALTVAENSDVVVLCLGLDETIEGEEGDASNEYAAGDKHDLDFPKVQRELLKKVVAVGKPVILVSMTGSAMNFTWADEKVSAIVQAWYPGGEGGRAIAQLIFGEYSPSGRLPVTVYRTSEELPEFTDYSMKNRTYRYMKNEAMYPFGYGLSYTKFEYSAVTGGRVVFDGGAKIKVMVKNIGAVEGMEAVQLYIKDDEASVDIPNYSLRGVKTVFLKLQEEAEVEFELTLRDLSIVDYNGDRLIEDGTFSVYIGGGQPDKRTEELLGCKTVKYELEYNGGRKVLERGV